MKKGILALGAILTFSRTAAAQVPGSIDMTQNPVEKFIAVAAQWTIYIGQAGLMLGGLALAAGFVAMWFMERKPTAFFWKIVLGLVGLSSVGWFVGAIASPANPAGG